MMKKAYPNIQKDYFISIIMIILVETINKGGFASVKLALSRINK